MSVQGNGFILCDVLSATECAVTVLWRSAIPGEITIECGGLRQTYDSSGKVQWASVPGLQPDTDYNLRVAAQGQPQEFHLRTLPQPSERPRFTFAVVADPHISFGKDCAHGRLFHESRQLLEETVQEINAEGADLALLPGDITEDGLEAEMREAQRILQGLQCPCVPVFGDHELVGNNPGVVLEPKRQRALWGEIFGQPNTYFQHEQDNLLFLALDTDLGDVDNRQFTWLAEQLASSRHEAIVIGTHRSIFPNPALLDDEPVGQNGEALRRLLEQQSQMTVVFAGHKNVPTVIRAGGAWQLTCPQICEFPCGYLIVKVYAHCWTYSLRPICSGALMDKSYVQCLASGGAQWEPTYRLGRLAGRYGTMSWENTNHE